MTDLQMLKAIRKNLTESSFNATIFGPDRPHCVIGELALLSGVGGDWEMAPIFPIARKLFAKGFAELNHGNTLTYARAMQIVDAAIRRQYRISAAKKETE